MKVRLTENPDERLRLAEELHELVLVHSQVTLTEDEIIQVLVEGKLERDHRGFE